MKITLDIKDRSLNAFLELIGSLEYVSVSEEQDIPKEQIDEVNRRLELIAKGEMKTRTWEEAKKDIFKRP